MAMIAQLPPAGQNVAITVAITADANAETWSRDFNGHIMCSRLWSAGGRLCERLGPLTLVFKLTPQVDAIDWQLYAVRYLGIPLPLRLFSGTKAREYLEDGRYHFDVGAVLPVIGLLVRYRGWLVEKP